MKKLIVLLALLCLVLCGCGRAVETETDSSKLQIACSNFPAYDFAREIAGDRAQLTLLIKPGAEVHSYEPSPKDVVRIHASSGTTGKQIVVGYTADDLEIWNDCCARQLVAIGCDVTCVVLLNNSYFHFFIVFSNNCIVTQCSEPCCLINALQSMPMTLCWGNALWIMLSASSSLG